MYEAVRCGWCSVLSFGDLGTEGLGCSGVVWAVDEDTTNYAPLLPTMLEDTLGADLAI